jgi:polysaccharide pyruvyl transferase WcaK-like protein
MAKPSTAPRVALFGLLGSGNIGNHGSFDAMLQFLRAKHPEARLSCVCAGPEEMERQYGIRSRAINWYHRFENGRRGRAATAGLKTIGKAIDVFRTLLWVRQVDVVIVPGMGVLEATLPIRPWGLPFALFLVAFWGRVCGTKVALVSVGANPIRQPGTRWFFRHAARLATYRSYRDAPARDAMRQMGIDTSRDAVYPDLAFALPDVPTTVSDEIRTVGVGVMSYHGTYLDRRDADAIYAAYTQKTTDFVRWLVDNDYRVRLFTGDPSDQAVVDAILADLRSGRPGLPDDRLVAEPADSLGELMRRMAEVDAVVASRYHNVLSALKLAKPTISVSYASKNDVLMQDMGLGEYCQPIRDLDVPLLIEQFGALGADRDRVRHVLLDRREHNQKLLDEQNAVLSATLFGAGPAKG